MKYVVMNMPGRFPVAVRDTIEEAGDVVRRLSIEIAPNIHAGDMRNSWAIAVVADDGKEPQ